MPAADAMSQREFDDALEAAPEFSRHSEFDCWPDWPSDAEDPAVIEAAARQNRPAIVFGDMVRLLGMTFAIVAVMDFSLRIFLH
jgi:hypothetical protein